MSKINSPMEDWEGFEYTSEEELLSLRYDSKPYMSDPFNNPLMGSIPDHNFFPCALQTDIYRFN